jgi:hypothetical protein
MSSESEINKFFSILDEYKRANCNLKKAFLSVETGDIFSFSKNQEFLIEELASVNKSAKPKIGGEIPV